MTSIFVVVPTGVCLCDDGFAGDDCSVDLSELPTLISIDGGPLCDLSRKNCSYAEIYGIGFVNMGTLRCELKELKVMYTKFSIKLFKFWIVVSVGR